MILDNGMSLNISRMHCGSYLYDNASIQSNINRDCRGNEARENRNNQTVNRLLQIQRK